MFQSTHPRGVRLAGDGIDITHLGRFNPRTRVGCDVHFLQSGSLYTWFQSTHPRGVRRAYLLGSQRTDVVSIHAPAWGATRHDRWIDRRQPSFNPRTRVGCDTGLL